MRLGMHARRGHARVLGDRLLELARLDERLGLAQHVAGRLADGRIALGEAQGRAGRRLDQQQLDDGRLEYLGRLDGQLKIRGFRIEPGEIEAVLASHPAVANAAITDECPPNGERRLVAWLVALLLVAEPLRNTGKYTMADVLSFRLKPGVER